MLAKTIKHRTSILGYQGWMASRRNPSASSRQLADENSGIADDFPGRQRDDIVRVLTAFNKRMGGTDGATAPQE